MIQRLPVFMSGSDIATGTRWASTLADQLAKSTYGIICVTSENFASPWINFEAGAISNAVGQPRVAPMLLDIPINDVGPPLSLFQMGTVTKNDVLQLVTSINDAEGLDAVSLGILEESFANYWPRFNARIRDVAIPDLETQLEAARKNAAYLPKRDRGPDAAATPFKPSGFPVIVRAHETPTEQPGAAADPPERSGSGGATAVVKRLPRNLYEPAWRLIRDRLTRGNITFTFDPGAGVDYVAGSIAIETRLLDWGGSSLTATLRGGLNKIRVVMARRSGINGAVLVLISRSAGELDVKRLQKKCEARIGVAVFRDGALHGSEVAAALAPWLFEETARLPADARPAGTDVAENA